MSLEASVRQGFLMGTKEYQPKRSAFVREVPSDGAFELYGDMGTPPWPVQNAGKQGIGGTDSRTGATAVNTIDEGGQVTSVDGEERGLIVRNVDWEIVIPIYHNAINDQRTKSLEVWARGAAQSFEKHKDFLAFDALNKGEATTTYGAGYDALAYFSGSHVDPGAEYVTTQDNQFASALSMDNYETVRVAASKFKDSRGQPLGLQHNLLVVASDLERTGGQIASNRLEFGTGNNDINIYQGATRLLVAPGGWLDTTEWFVIDDSMVAKPLNMQIRQAPELVVWDDEFAGSGGIRYFKWHARYAISYGDWRLAAMGNT